ncbi:sensor histidine kinase [Actinophytocola sp.]|uniref:sensor histidine kinase n=1 Tax=Actinophytocola sp. TaxID=1872138 RepID=UPI002D80FC69|nr:ATP-binding protein [Actinophytocola sp.]HET9141240.1 ATP-binding protein [Actinophytocola sp.]
MTSSARRGLPARRTRAGLGVAVVGLAGLTALLAPARVELSLASVALLYLVPVVAAAAIGGVRPALAAAIAADLLVNFFFVPPFHTLLVESGDAAIVLVVYVLVAATVAVTVEVAARYRARAARRDAEAALLAHATAEPVTEQSLTRLLEQVRDTFAMAAVALLESGPSGEHPVASVGQPPPGRPVLSAPAGNGLRLAAWGPDIFAEDRRALSRLAAAAARTLEAQRLADQAARARELAEVDRVRSALLAAVGHDLRTPLAAVKAAVSSLRQSDIDLPSEAKAELLATIEESTDRLDALVDNLLSMSRLQAGALSVHPQPVALDAVVAQALLHTAAGGAPVRVDIPDDLPLAYVDSGLLERVVANLVANALAASPPDRPIRLHGLADADGVRLQVVDHGPGIPEADRDRVFEPFQRLHDRTTVAGLGLGLAIARGFTEAMDGTITPTETPGGGLTMTVGLPTAPGPVSVGGS